MTFKTVADYLVNKDIYIYNATPPSASAINYTVSRKDAPSILCGSSG